MSQDDHKRLDQRHFLQCMAWVGTGAVWTLSGGVLKGTPLGQATSGSMMSHGASGLRFVQISDSHIGFDKPANNDVAATLRAAVANIKADPEPPAFVLHTGDLTHLSKAAEFDTLQQILSELSLPVFYAPGDHDVLEDDGKNYLQWPDNIVSTAQKFKSPVLDTDQQFSDRFDAASTYKHFCSIRPEMTGQIVVR